MKTNIHILSIIFVLTFNFTFSQNQKTEISTYQSFLKTQKLSAKDYILSLFKDHDIVIISERHHGDIEQYKLFFSVISNPYFVKNVGAVYTEVGVINKQKEFNDFLNSTLSDSLQVNQKVIELYQNADYNQLWTYYNFPWLLKNIYQLNQENKDQQVNLYPCDLAFDWKNVSTIEEYEKFEKSSAMKNRDSTMAENFLYQYKSIQKKRNGKKKALVIMNTRHGYLKDTHYDEKSVRNNFGRYLKESPFGSEVASVYLMGMGNPNSWKEYTVIKDGMWDYAFESTGKTNNGFDLNNTPFGLEKFDVTPNGWAIDNYLYQDVFTGIVFYEPIEKHTKKTSWQGVLTPEFIPEMKRRLKLMGYDDKGIQEMMDFYKDVQTSSCYYNIEKERKKINNNK